MKNFKTYDIEGLCSFENRRFEDERGFFYESFNQKIFDEATGSSINFVQDNISHSKKNVLRGVHFQKPPYSQSKLVRILKGKALDIAVDLRKDSRTYGETFSIILTDKNFLNLFVPKGFAHGFVALEEDTVFSYKCDEYYNAQSEDAILWNDPTLNIDWGVVNPIISEKDREAQAFKQFISPF